MSDMVNELLKTISWQSQDCFVIMGEPRWVAGFTCLYVYSMAYLDGAIDLWAYSGCPVETMEKGGYFDVDLKLVMYPARFMNLLTTFTERKCVERVEGDKVVKTSVFKHGGFVPLL